MDINLWHKIQAFDLDAPLAEYCFSIRLARENYWTRSFTEQAITEYKKFMYLAATADFMVSPSEIVDKVWHQHLVFTQSYSDFCQLIGKAIQHIPSVHNKEEAAKFRQAKEKTDKYYKACFGEAPKSIWEYKGMYESLHLQKAKIKLRSFINIGVGALICLILPAYFLLQPLYVQLDNPFFLYLLGLVSGLSFIGLEYYNRHQLQKICAGFDKNAFIYHLQPIELVYLKTQNLIQVINGSINELINKEIIHIESEQRLELNAIKKLPDIAHTQIVALLASGINSYPDLLRSLLGTPIFSNTAHCMQAFHKYCYKSQKFGKIFYVNFCLLSLLLLCSFSRIITGLSRDKPITLIVILTLILGVCSILFLQRLSKQMSTRIIPRLYKNELLVQRELSNHEEWNYFLLGALALNSAFAPMVNEEESKGQGSSGSDSCGSSCGSSCSSCGGCGSD